MDFSSSAEEWGGEKFEATVLDDLDANKGNLPIDDLCTEGGWPDNCVEFEIDSTFEEDDEIFARVTVYFTEVVPGACADLPWREDQRGGLLVRINKKTGEAEAKRDYEFEHRNLENY